jgi:DNA-binding transcriptional LysR family regulator
VQLHNVDFNLLLPLRALLEERSVSRAAERMHMSQPALSAALARLRRHFNDELLERRGNSYTLTPLAAQRIVLAQAEFDPSTTTREFTVVSSDYGMSVLGGPLATVLSEEAPHARLRFHAISASLVTGAPDSVRHLDGLLMPHGFITDGSREDLFVDRWVCVVAADNAVVGDTLSLDQLSGLPWVHTLSGPSEYTPAAKQLQLLGVEPKVEVVSPSFLATPSLLRGSNRIALVQESLARQMATDGTVRVLEAPFDVVPLVEAFWWNPVYDRYPDHVWFRSILHEAVRRGGLRSALPARPAP